VTFTVTHDVGWLHFQSGREQARPRSGAERNDCSPPCIGGVGDPRQIIGGPLHLFAENGSRVARKLRDSMPSSAAAIQIAEAIGISSDLERVFSGFLSVLGVTRDVLGDNTRSTCVNSSFVPLGASPVGDRFSSQLWSTRRQLPEKPEEIPDPARKTMNSSRQQTDCHQNFTLDCADGARCSASVPGPASPQRGGWQLAIERAIITGESAETIKAISPCHLGNTRCIRVSAPQRAAYLLHGAEATIAARAHTQVFFAAIAQRALRYAERPADVRHVQGRFGNEQILKPGENVAVAAVGRRFLLRPFR
jgi:hypothetical protein